MCTYVCMHVHSKALQSCLILCNSMDCSPAGSSLHEILQARVLVWAAMPFSKESANPVIKATSLICLLHRQLGSLPLMPPVCAQSLQSCLTLYDPMDSSPTGSSVHGVVLARILEWVAISSSWVSSRLRASCIANSSLPSEPQGKHE